MSYTSLFLCALFCVSFAQQRTEVLKDGAFNFPFVTDEDVRQQDGVSTMYVTTSHRCVHSFVVNTDLDQSSVITVEKITGVQGDEYTWGKVGEAEAKQGVFETTIELQNAPVCASTWRLVVQSSKPSPWKDVSILADEVENKKRAAIVCDAPETYPVECQSASDGAKCLTGLVCGCVEDKDCFSNTDFPYCTAAGVCERCTEVETSPATSNKDHLFCRSRYPGYATQPTSTDPLVGERVAPNGYYREVCVRTPLSSSGSCQRCNQAPPQPYNLGTNALNQGASGTFHCNLIDSTKPICMDKEYMTFTGGMFVMNKQGSCGPCTVNRECSVAIATKPVCKLPAGTCGPCAANADCSAGATGNGGSNCQKDGSCRSCTSNTDCGTLDGGETAGQPSCDTTTGICGALFQCTDNASCNGKGGNNCQLDKSCLSCTSNANCGGLDGGEIAGQPVCNTATGICGKCSSNADCGTLGNCQADGSCKICKANTDCGTLDGGESSGQAICNTQNGICENACNTNTFCNSKPGKNCQKDGNCLSCVTDATCGTLDGGETPDQSKCNTQLGICITPFTCTDNPSCSNAAQTGNGKNCQKDGSCISCTPATCAALDGGEAKDQPNCDSVTRLCVDACDTNADCVNTQGANCNKNGICITCTSNADCGTTDGGETQDQELCNTVSGICEAACASNADCVGAGKNCNTDGTCVSCTTNADCINDGGEIKGQPACDTATGQCTACRSNSDCSTGTPNCGVDGGCYSCNAPGNSCGIMDGPQGGPGDGQPHCDTFNGLCVNYCTSDEHCGDDCAPFCQTNRGCCVQCRSSDDCPGANWREDQAELDVCSSISFTCVKGCSVDSDCGDYDKPACSPTTGECVECLFDAHCEGFSNSTSGYYTKVCSSAQTCVECVGDSHCEANEHCNEFRCTTRDDLDSAGLASFSLVVALLYLIASLF